MKNILGNTDNLKLFNLVGNQFYTFYKNSDGYSYEKIYDSNGNQLSYKDSDGYSWKKTYDSNGNELTYKNSDGETRRFDVPEYTMEEHKKETIEEAAINNYPEGDVWNVEQAVIRRLAFMKGAKWMQEQMYSEEELTLKSE